MLLGLEEPLVQHLVDNGTLVVEVALDDLLEVLGRLAELADHGVLNGSGADDLVVAPRVLVSPRGPNLRLVAWLVEEGRRHHDERLDGDEHLQQRGCIFVPVFRFGT